MRGEALNRLWQDLRHEGRLTWTWGHAAVLLVLVPFTIESVTASMGLNDRNVLILGRVAAPLLGVALAPGLILRDVLVGSAELVATTRTGLNRVWLVRFLITLAWSIGALLLLIGSLVTRAQTRFSPAAEMAASTVDLLLYMTTASAAAHRLAGPTAGQVAGLILWSVGLLVGTHPPADMPWLGYFTPLSPYFFGPPSILLLNRMAWGALALFLIIWEFHRLNHMDMFVRKES